MSYLGNYSIDNQLTKKQVSTILSYVSDVFGFYSSSIYNFHNNNKHDQYGILMRIIDKIESLALEWNGKETSYNILIEYDFTAVTFDFTLGLEETPVVISSYGTDGNKIEAILKTLYKLAHWHYNVYLEPKIIGYQIYIDNNLDHYIHETFEVIEKDSINLNDYLNTAIIGYPESVISLKPVKQSEIENPSFV